MNIEIVGGGHSAETLRTAAQVRDINVGSNRTPDLIFIALDILDHQNIEHLKKRVDETLASRYPIPTIVISQIPPGFMRARDASKHQHLFYQVDTLIVMQALERMLHPEQYIIGCADPSVALPLVYQEYLSKFGAVFSSRFTGIPVRQMSYESAELTKLAINYFLNIQIESANRLSAIATLVGADWPSVVTALRGDARIGPYAYLRPGEPNQHLLRDIDTIMRIVNG